MRPLAAIPNRHSVVGLLLVSVLLSATACEDLISDKPVETRDDTFQVSGAVTLDVDVFNGSVTVTSSDSNEVRVQATVRRADRVEYEARRFGSNVQVQANEIGSTSGRSPSASVEITAPPNSELILRTSNGSVTVNSFDTGAIIRTSNGRVTVNGLRGELEIGTSNGAIEVSGFTGSAELETSNSSIRFEGSLVPGSVNDFSTSNGSITVDLPGTASVDFDGATSNGSVSSELPIQVVSSGDNHLEGVIGDGQAELTARTSNGSITVR